jgi:hypothetical protein
MEMDPERLAVLIEEEHLLDFQDFYQGLPDRRAPFFMFFTSGLLHWVAWSMRFVPPEINLVVLGSALESDELAWVRKHLGRPFHHIELEVDDKTVWEFLFATSEHHFGWLDIDCFVLDPALFQAMTRIEPDVLANCAFSFRSLGGLDILLTYFLFLNVDVIRAVEARVPVSPCTYTYERSRAARVPAYAYARTLTPGIVERLAQVLPLDPEGRPKFLTESHYFDTLQVYQLVAHSLGYRLNPVRSPGRKTSDEVVHIGKVSYYRTRWSDPDSPEKRQAYALLLQTEYLALTRAPGSFPSRYVRLREELAEQLERLGIPADARRIADNLRSASTVPGAGDIVARIVEVER